MTSAVLEGPRPARDRPAGERSVVHAIFRYGQLSQTFIASVVEDLDRLGWRAWVISQAEPVNRDVVPFPPPERLLRPRRPSRLQQARLRLSGRGAADRGLVWWRDAIEEVGPSLLHVHFGWTAASVAFERLDVPLLVSFHGSDVNAWPHQSAANLAGCRRLFGGLRHATATSEFIAGRVRELGYTGELHLLPPGVRLADFPFRAASEAPGAPRLLFVGRQTEVKGLQVLLRALPPVVARHPDLHLEVIGDGPDRAANEALAREAGVAGHVTFAGGRPHAEVAAAMARSHVFVAPSRTSATGEAEGSPVAPKEALATGMQVVATDVGGMREVLPPEWRHELAADGDVDGLARALLAALDRRPGWGERAARGRAWVEAEFDADRLSARLARIYETVAG